MPIGATSENYTGGDYDAMNADLKRRRRLQAMLEQSALASPSEGLDPRGRFGIGAALAPILKGYLAYQQGESLKKDELAADERDKTQAADWLARMPKDQPDQVLPGGEAESAEGGMTPGLKVPGRQVTGNEMLPWVLEASNLSGRRGQEMAKTMVPIAMKNLMEDPAVTAAKIAAKSPKIQSIFDEKSGREVKAMVDGEGNVVRYVGGTKAEEHPGLQKTVQFLMSPAGGNHSLEEAIARAGGERGFISTQDNVYPTDKSKLYTMGGNAAGGVGVTPPVGRPGPFAQGAPAPAPTTQPPTPAPAAPPTQNVRGPLGGGGGVDPLAGTPYARPVVAGPGLGTGFVQDNTKGEAKLSADVEQYGKDLTTEKLPELEVVLSDVEKLIKEHTTPEGKAKDIPGVGWLANAFPGLNKEAHRAQQTIAPLKRLITRSEAGLSQTEAEIRGVLQTLGLTATSSENDFRQAVPVVRKVLEERKATLSGKYHPRVIEEFRKRRGAGAAWTPGVE